MRSSRRSKSELCSQVLLKADFVSAATHDGSRPFPFVATGFSPPIGSPQMSKKYGTVHNVGLHSHPLDVSCMTTCLPLPALQEMKYLKNDFYFLSTDTIRVIERKTGFRLDKKAVKNSSTFHRSQLFPVHRDAAEFS